MRAPNVYETYVQNDCRVGFWVQRNSWGRTCARVKLIGGRASGALPGTAPFYSNVAVHVDIHDLSTGKLKESNVLLSCPGTNICVQAHRAFVVSGA